jgi:EAL domain-containing protein (putative c-di-GMP-specific phosphodiesterase class I)
MLKPRRQPLADAMLVSSADRLAEVFSGGATLVSSAPRLAETGSDENAVVFKERVREAAEQGRFHLNYQPIVSLKTGRPVAVEALLRWDSEVGPVPPARFVPVLEELGLILPVGDWVLERACRQGRQWLDDYPTSPLNIAVNVSAHQIDKIGFARIVHWILDSTRLPAGRLCLEITDTMAIREPKAAWNELRQLKALGVRLSIDDFGTAHSSMNFVKTFSVDALKIDRSFVAGVGRNPEDYAIVKAVITLGHALGLETVAEGIEDEEQLGHLVELGCDLGQGYYFSEPQPAGTIDALIGRTALSQP